MSSPGSQPDPSPARGPAGAPAPALGSAVGRGMSFTAANSVISKLLSFLSLIVIGWHLDDRDFGLYAMALSIAAFTQIFREGGVVQLLIQRGEAEYQRLLGPVFWMAFAFNTGTALVLSLIAPVAASLKGEPQLAPLIWVLAVSLPLATPGLVLAARLQMDLRFGYVNGVTLGSAVIRYVGTISLALTGFGPMSFVLPMPVVALYEGVAYYLAVRHAPWRHRPELRRWRELFAQSKWLIFFAFAVATVNQGAYLVIGIALTAQQVGVFAFAFQLISQVDALLGTLGLVLFPALVRLNDDPERQSNATLRVVRVLMFLTCPAALGLAAVVDPLEQAIWQGKWHAAVWPVQALAVFYAARILVTVPIAALQARGLFRFNALLTLLVGLGMSAAAGLGVYLGWREDPEHLTHAASFRIAECMGVAIGIFCGGLSVVGLKRMGVGRRRLMRAVAPTWLIAVAAAAAALLGDWLTRGGCGAASRQIAAWLARQGLTLAQRDGAPTSVEGILRFALAFVIYCVVYALLLRALTPLRLGEALVILPARFRGAAARLARLRPD